MLLKMRTQLHSIVRMVPVHRLFLKFFLAFCVAALATLSVAILAGHFTGLQTISPPKMYATIAPLLAAEAVHVYETEGPSAFARFSQSNLKDREWSLYLLDGFNKDVLSRPLSDDGLKTARAAKLGQLVVFRGHIAAYKFISGSGRPYVLMLYLRTGITEFAATALGKELPVTIISVLFMVLLCLGLAFDIASPIQQIQSTARRVAEGDLSARVSPPVSSRHDELAFLAKDFDSMVERLEALIGAQRKLLNSVSHELRSPLTRIGLSVALLRDGPVAENEDIFIRLERDIGRIDSLIGQLLTLSRLESGLGTGERIEVNLSQLVQEVAADGNFEAQMSGKSVTLQINDSIVIDHADPGVLRSACENIIRNAIRFTPTGTEVKVVLAAGGEYPKSRASLSVHDQGPGVPKEFLQSIFQPFVRVDQNDEHQAGNGLGLAIALEAVRIHHGVITAANVQPRGFEIKIELPIFNASSDRRPVPQPYETFVYRPPTSL